MSLSEVIRREFKESDDARDAGLTTPDDVVRYDNIRYVDRDIAKEYSGWQLLDVYRPKKARDEKLPVIVSVHGGAWVYGDKEVYQYYCMDLCRRGFAVVNFSYRLAPEFSFPAQLEDTCDAFAWVLANAEQYGFDTERIYGVGDSAGANILGVFCLLCTNEEYAARYAFKAPGKCAAAGKRSGTEGGAFGKGDVSRKTTEIASMNDIVANLTEAMNVKGERNVNAECTAENARSTEAEHFVPNAIGLHCGIYEVKPDGDRNILNFMKDVMPEHGNEEELDMVNLVKYINKDFPPTFFMTCEGDFLKGQAPILEKRLEEEGVPYVRRFYGDEANPLGHVFHCNIRLDEAKICNDENCAFFGKY